MRMMWIYIQFQLKERDEKTKLKAAGLSSEELYIENRWNLI